MTKPTISLVWLTADMLLLEISSDRESLHFNVSCGVFWESVKYTEYSGLLDLQSVDTEWCDHSRSDVCVQ
eukprot:2868297-Amphidinium_carterae.1